MFIDSHAHFFDDKIQYDLVDMQKIDAVIVPSYSMQNLDKCLDFCKKHNKCFCFLGVHPAYVNDFDLYLFKKFVLDNFFYINGIGEIGIDINYDTDIELQKKVFIEQVKIAYDLHLPISVHLRSKNDFKFFFDLIYPYKNILKIAFHCFNGDMEDLKKCLEIKNSYISFANNITYRGNVKLREVAKSVPSDRLLIETDSPGLLPAHFARHGVNTPQNVVFVAEKIAELKGYSLNYIAKMTSENAKKFLNIGDNNATI